MNKFILFVVIGFFLIGNALSNTLVVNTGNSGQTLFNDTVGYEFNVGGWSLTVNQLGVLGSQYGGNQVGIWTPSGVLLASLTIPANAPSSGGYLWGNLSNPVILDANTTYIIGACGTDFTGENRASGFPTLSSDVSLVCAARNNQQYVFSFPNAVPQLSGEGIIGPNLSYTVNPADQTIAPFGAIPTQTNGVSFTVTPPTATSGLPVTISMLSGAAFLFSNTITPYAAGTIVLAADQSGNDSYNAAPEVTVDITVAPANQSISSPSIPTENYGVGSITLHGTASSGLPISYSVSGPATISNNILTITGAGTVTFIASQSGNSNYNAALPVTNSFIVNPENQSIAAFATIPALTNGVPYSLSPPTASSGLPVSVTLKSGPATILSNSITPNGIGTVTLAADQSGNGNVNPAPEVTTTFIVKDFDQTIAPFGIPAVQTYGKPFTIKPPRSSSGLQVTPSILSGPATIQSNTITPTGVGTVTLAADQPGNSIYFAAPEVTVPITIIKANQTILFHELPPQKASLTPLTLNASSSSGLGVSYRVDSGPASVSGNLLSLNGEGRVFITASQTGNTNYNTAKPVSINFQVKQASQKITFPPIATKALDNSPVSINPTASSGLPVSVVVASGAASVLDNQVTLTGAGIVVLKASQKGNGIYATAPPATVSFRVKNYSQTIAPFTIIPNQTLGSQPFKITPPQASSNLFVTVTVKSGPAKMTGGKIILTGVGTVVLGANQLGNNEYTAAPEVTTSFEVK